MAADFVKEARALAQDLGFETDGTAHDLSDLKIWLGASSHDTAVISLADDCRTVLGDLGATVNGSKQFDPLTRAKIDDSDMILMIAATPGVSARTLEICFISRRDNNCNRDKLRSYMPKLFASGHIHKRLERNGASHIEMFEMPAFEGSNSQVVRQCVHDVCSEVYNRRRKRMLRSKEFVPTIGVITALALELRAVRDALTKIRTDPFREQGSPYREYIHGVVPCKHGGKHEVVVGLAGKGNNKAAVLATSLMNRYPSIEDVFMVGVAAGVPNVENANQHVRLGDIVVCDEGGVIQYDMVKKYRRRKEYIPPPRPPGHAWITRCENYMATMKAKPKYWKYLDKILKKQNIKRPHNGPLKDCPWVDGVKAVKQPLFPGHDRTRPRIHQGPIGCANTVLKSAKIRGTLKKIFRIKAVEMESSGIAEAAWQHGKGYFIVRGICDFANDDKNKVWQPYAAAAAAAFARELIETMPLSTPVAE